MRSDMERNGVVVAGNEVPVVCVYNHFIYPAARQPDWTYFAGILVRDLTDNPP